MRVSLASLNQCAVGIAQRLLEDVVAARIQESTWVHLEFDPIGRLSVTYPPVPSALDPQSCPLCKLTGWGEEGIPRVVAFLHQEPGEPTATHTADTTPRVATPVIQAGTSWSRITPVSRPSGAL